jgi:hypothetical protein
MLQLKLQGLTIKCGANEADLLQDKFVLKKQQLMFSCLRSSCTIGAAFKAALHVQLILLQQFMLQLSAANAADNAALKVQHQCCAASYRRPSQFRNISTSILKNSYNYIAEADVCAAVLCENGLKS